MVLHQIGVGAGPELRHHDVAALDQAHLARRVRSRDAADDVRDPRPGRVDEAAGAEGACFSRRRAPRRRICRRHRPGAVLAAGRNDGRAGEHLRPPFGGVERVEHHQARIVDPAVGIFEAARIAIEQRRPFRIAPQVQRARARQPPAPAQMVVEEQAEPHQPGRPVLRAVRQHEAQRPDDVGCGLQQHLALDQRLAHQPELVIFEIAQPPVHQLARARRRPFGQVPLLGQHNRQPTPRRIPRKTSTVDPTADHKQIDHPGLRAHPASSRRRPARGRRIPAFLP